MKMRRLSIATGVVAVVMTAGAMFAPAAGAATPGDPPNPGNDSSSNAPQKSGHKLSKPPRPDSDAENPTSNSPSGTGENSADGQQAAHSGRLGHPAKQGGQFDDNGGGVAKPGHPAADADDSVGNPQVNKPAKPLHRTRPAADPGAPADEKLPKGDNTDNGKAAPAQPGKSSPATPAITDEGPDSTPAKPGHPVKSTSHDTGIGGQQTPTSEIDPTTHTRPVHHYRSLHHPARPLTPGYRPLTHRSYRPLPHRFGGVHHSANPATPPTDEVTDPSPKQSTEASTTGQPTTHPVRPLHHSTKSLHHRHLHRSVKPIGDENAPMTDPKGMDDSSAAGSGADMPPMH
jgi:hypothetical protein